MNEKEIEVKFYIKNLKRIEQRLQDLGARLIQPRTFENNLRFDLPDGSLRSEGKVLRLRQDTQARLTYKGASSRTDGVLSREELETTMGEFEAGHKILLALGYVQVATYEKYRSIYAWDDLHVMLDELPYGHFVEVEGPDAETLKKASAELGLDFGAAIPASYLFLFDGLCRKTGLNPSHLTFPALEGFEVGAEDLGVRVADELKN